jgi:phosphate starvation-inducible PhoH-like protein
MKMFLTRMGEDSKIIVTGDVTQVDLPRGAESGLVHATRVLGRVEGLTFCYLSAGDIVRHPVVRAIVKSYASFDERMKQGDGANGNGAPRKKRVDRK